MDNSELIKLVDSIKRGEQIVLFPPGTFIFAFGIVIAIAGFVYCVATLINLFAPNLPIPTKAITQLGSLVFVFLGYVLPGLLISRGLKFFANIIKGMMIIVILVALGAIVWAFIANQTLYIQPLAISITLTGVSLTLLNTPSFKVLCEFFYLLRKKDYVKPNNSA